MAEEFIMMQMFRLLNNLTVLDVTSYSISYSVEHGFII